MISEKLARQRIRDYILQKKNQKEEYVAALDVASKLTLDYQFVKDAFHELASEGILKSLEYSERKRE